MSDINLANFIPEAVISAILGWFGYQAKRRDKRVDKIEENLNGLALLVARDYITRKETNNYMKEVREFLQRIEDKLDNKADK